MSKPTPGPWLVRKFYRKSYVVDSTPDDPTGDFRGQSIAVETTAPETIANLHLIAAAPDYYDASEKLFAAKTKDDSEAAIALLRAAHTKAEAPCSP